MKTQIKKLFKTVVGGINNDTFFVVTDNIATAIRMATKHAKEVYTSSMNQVCEKAEEVGKIHILKKDGDIFKVLTRNRNDRNDNTITYLQCNNILESQFYAKQMHQQNTSYWKRSIFVESVEKL